MNSTHFIFTVGYGNRSIEDFVSVLLKYGIKYLVDLRTSPYSKFKIDFNKEALEKRLQESFLKYIFMGDKIGGLPSDRSCYTDDRVDYDKIKTKDFYNEGIARLIKAYEGGHLVAIMCSEGKPETCHRSKLIGVTLETRGIPVMHIDDNGELVSQEEVIRRVVGDQLDLFKGATDDLKSKGRYHVNR